MNRNRCQNRNRNLSKVRTGTETCPESQPNRRKIVRRIRDTACFEGHLVFRGPSSVLRTTCSSTRWRRRSLTTRTWWSSTWYRRTTSSGRKERGPLLQNFFHPGSRIRTFFHPGSASKNLCIFNPKIVSKLSGCSSRIWILIFYPSWIPYPGVIKSPDPGSGFATLVHQLSLC